MPKRIDLTGQHFGELTVIRLSDQVDTRNKRLWECQCTCGRTTYVLGPSLVHGHYKSCGCLRISKRDKGAKRHIKKDRVDGTRLTALTVKPHKDNKSGHKGVVWLKDRQKYKAYIGIKGKQITLGYFTKIEDAIAARKQGEQTYHKPILEDKNE